VECPNGSESRHLMAKGSVQASSLKIGVQILEYLLPGFEPFHTFEKGIGCSLE
jgi:hypothetical protein